MDVLISSDYKIQIVLDISAMANQLLNAFAKLLLSFQSLFGHKDGDKSTVLPVLILTENLIY